jgi:N-acetylglucosaminyldiphosphoundecaprenol N-acetyl-beta-D-mannosaminyltransferase
MSETRVDLLGVPVDRLSWPDVLRRVRTHVERGQPAQILYANAHTLNLAYRSPVLRRAFEQVDVVYCDGAGARLGALLLGESLPRRMTGADWIYDLCALCQKEGYSLYLLGGERGVASRTAAYLQASYPGLQIVGVHHGYFDPAGRENENVVDAITVADPDILLVGTGSPRQELWIHDNASQLNGRVVWAVGAMMDFVIGKKPRAPRWMLDHGLEWLGRLVAEPQRLWKRYLVGNPLFLWRVVKQRLGWHNRADMI